MRYPKVNQKSQEYSDDNFEYLHIKLCESFYKRIKNSFKLSSRELLKLGLVKDKDWEHYYVYPNEPHILLLRRPKENF